MNGWGGGDVVFVGLGGGSDVLLARALAESALAAGGNVMQEELWMGKDSPGAWNGKPPVAPTGCVASGQAPGGCLFDIDDKLVGKQHPQSGLAIGWKVQVAVSGSVGVVVVPRNGSTSNPGFHAGKAQFAQWLNCHCMQALIGGFVCVDGGADSLIEPHGRDACILDLLLSTGLPVLHVVVGPGLDGQSPQSTVVKALQPPKVDAIPPRGKGETAHQLPRPLNRRFWFDLADYSSFIDRLGSLGKYVLPWLADPLHPESEPDAYHGGHHPHWKTQVAQLLHEAAICRSFRNLDGRFTPTPVRKVFDDITRSPELLDLPCDWFTSAIVYEAPAPAGASAPHVPGSDPPDPSERGPHYDRWGEK